MNKHTYLNKERTLMIHGVAILMMIYHHIFLDGNYWFINEPKTLFSIFDFINFSNAQTFQQAFAWFCRICVAIFTFTSGYGIYIQYENRFNGEINILALYKYAFKRIFTFYKKYLLMFIIFVSLELLTNAFTFDQYEISEYIMSMLGFSTTLNFTWWYVSQYYFMVLLSPIIYFLLNKFKLKHYLLLAGIFILSVIISFILGYGIEYIKFYTKNIQTQLLMFLIIFIEGMFVSRFNLIDYFAKKINLFISIIICLAVICLRMFLARTASDSLFDIVLIFPFVLALTRIFSYFKHEVIFSFLGKYSTYMWFVHAYFYAYVFFVLILKADQSIFVYLQVVLYTLVTSILLTNVETIIKKIKINFLS